MSVVPPPDHEGGLREPPHDLNAEQAVLGAALTSRGAAEEVTALLGSGDYYRPAHQIVHEAIGGLLKNGHAPDPITVADELRRRRQLTKAGGGPYLHTLIASVPTAANAGYYAGIVARLAAQRHRAELATRLAQLAYQADADEFEIAELAGMIAGGADGQRRGGLPVVDLEPAAEDAPPPVLICGDRLYRGAVHTLTGPPDCGKTTLACWWMLQAVREEGGVLFLDEEGGRDIVTEKFQALGAKRGERIGYVQFPARSWSGEDLAMLAAVLAERRPALVTWDSSAAFLARAGLDENAAADVTRFYSQVLTLAARHQDAAVLAIDHDTKGGEMSRYARGSGAKLAAVDVAYKIAPVRPFSKTDSGLSKLTVTKDRRGWLDRSHEVTFLSDLSAQVPLTLSIAAASGERGTEYAEMPPARAKLLAALDDTPADVRTLVDRIQAEHHHGLRRETVSRELGELARCGLADRVDQGRGKTVLWMRNPSSDL